MNGQSRNKILLLLIAILLLTNLGMLYYYNRPQEAPKPQSRSERMAAWMREELGFNDAQVEAYMGLRARRDSLLKPLNADLRAAKMEMIELLRREDVPDTLVRNVARKIAEKQVPVEEAYYAHFRRIQEICNDEQLPKFDTMLTRMVIRSTGGQAPGPGRERENN